MNEHKHCKKCNRMVEEPDNYAPIACMVYNRGYCCRCVVEAGLDVLQKDWTQEDITKKG